VHEKPESEGGHGGPLTLDCFFDALGLNASVLGLHKGMLVHAFRKNFSRLVAVGWLTICDEACGGHHFRLSDKGREQLREWDEKGCESHLKKAGRKPAKGRCAAPALRRPRLTGGEAA